MKSIHFTLIFLFCLNPLTAQKKKAPAQKATPFVTVNTSLPYQLLGKDLDEAALQIDNVLSPKEWLFSKIEESKDYTYNQNKVKTDSVYNYYKTLTGSKKGKKFELALQADNDRKVRDVTLKFSDTTNINIGYPELELNKWGVVEKKGTQGIYQTKNAFLIINPNTINAFIPANGKNIKDFTEKKLVAYLRDFLMPLTKNDFILAQKKMVDNDEDYNFNSFYQLLYYKNGFNAKIIQDQNIEQIKITNPNKIVLSNFLSKLIASGYTKKYEEKSGRRTYTYYHDSKDNFVATVSDNNIEFHPLKDKQLSTDERIKKQDKIFSFAVNNIYNNFSDPEARKQYIQDFYTLGNDNEIIGLDENGNQVTATLFSQEEFNNNWGRKFAITLKTMQNKDDSVYNYNSDLTETRDSKNNTYYFYDSKIYAANKLSKEMKDNADQLAYQKSEAERKQREIEENNRKAQRNAELTQGLQQLTNQLLKIK